MTNKLPFLSLDKIRLYREDIDMGRGMLSDTTAYRFERCRAYVAAQTSHAVGEYEWPAALLDGFLHGLSAAESDAEYLAIYGDHKKPYADQLEALADKERFLEVNPDERWALGMVAGYQCVADWLRFNIK